MKNYFRLLVLAAVLCFPMFLLAQYAGEHFIMHTSGLHLAKSSKGGIIESAAASNPQK